MELGTHHVEDRYEKMGVENIYIYTCRYVTVCINVFVYSI